MSGDKVIRSCIDCGVVNCDSMDKHYPDFCLTTKLDAETQWEALQLYKYDEENQKIAAAAAEVEAENYCRLTRIEETIEFSKKMGIKKIGIATCVGLIAEARTAAKIFRAHDLEVYGVGCKAGAVPKSNIGLSERCNSTGKNMCNPILQAKLLNGQKTDFNVVIGLCVGHDSLFFKYSEAPCTVLVAKDRVLAHNPVAALYQVNAYYGKLLKKK